MERAPGADDRLERNARFREELEEAFLSEVIRIRAARAVQAARQRARVEADLHQERLRENVRAAAIAALRDTDRAEVWVRSKHPILGGSPWNVCLENGGLARCLKLLEKALKR